MGRLLAVLPMLALACSANVPAPPDAPVAKPDAGIEPNDGAQSGTRLKLQWYAFSDGTRQWAGLYDAERKESCSPSEATWNGASYCLPGTSGSIVYSDAACSKPIIYDYTGGTCEAPPEPYTVDESANDCSGSDIVNHFYLKGSALATTTYYLDFGADCLSSSIDPSVESLSAIRSEASPADFVEMTLSAPAGSGAVGVRSWTSPDGVILPALMHDYAHGFDCTPQFYGDSAGSALCAPTDADLTYYDHNSSCSEPMVAIDTTCTSTPAYAEMNPSGYACPASLDTFYTIGSLISPAPANLYEPDGSSCYEYGADTTDYNYYAAGSALALAQLQRAPDTDGDHRIQLIHYTDGGSLSFRDPTYLYDSQEQVVCTPSDDGTGTTRCIPTSSYGVTTDYFYSDSKCMTPVDIIDIYTGPSSCPAPLLPSYVRLYSETTGCSDSYALYQLGTKATTLYYPYGGSNFDSCAKYTPDEEVLYHLGAQVSTSNFDSATLVTDE